MSESLEDSISICSVCTETLKDPRTLPCSHNFCLECLRADVESRGENGKYACLACHCEVDLCPEDVEKMGCNVMVKNLAAIEQHRDCDDPCVACQDRNPTMVCITCDFKRFCQNCGLFHPRHVASHQVVSLQEFRDGKHNDAIRERQSRRCEDHKELFKYYCKDCKRLVCNDCVNLGVCDHTGKSRCQINEAHEMAKKNLSQLLGQVEEKLKKLKDHQTQIQINNSLSSDTLLEQEQVIGEYFQTLTRALIGKESQRFKAMYYKNQAKRDAVAMATEKELNVLKVVKQNIEKVTEYGSATETLQLETCLQKEIEESGMDKELPSVPEPCILRFVPTYPKFSTDDIQKVSVMLGSMARRVFVFDIRVPDEEGAREICGLAIATDNTILAVSEANQKVMKFNDKGQPVGDPLVHDQLQKPWDCISLPDGSFKVSCEAGVITFGADGSTQLQEIENHAAGIAFTSTQMVVVTIREPAPDVRLYNPGGALVRKIGCGENGESMFQAPLHTAVTSKDNILIVDRDLKTIFMFDIDGNSLAQFVADDPLGGVCVDKNDFIYVVNAGKDEVISLTPNCTFHRVVLSNRCLQGPRAVAFDNKGLLWVSCYAEGTNVSSTVKAFKIEWSKGEDEDQGDNGGAAAAAVDGD